MTRLDFHRRTWHVRRSDAVRLERWLTRLHEVRHGTQPDARIVPYRSGLSASLVATFDGEACGCALCGEFAAEAGQPFEDGFKLLHVGNVPHDVRQIIGHAAILYCGNCFETHEKWLRLAFHVAPGEVLT